MKFRIEVFLIDLILYFHPLTCDHQVNISTFALI